MKKIVTLLSTLALLAFPGKGSAQDNACPVQELPFTEDFESGEIPCWTILDGNGDGYTWALQQISSENNTVILFSGRNAGREWLVSPGIALGEKGGVLSFRYRCYNRNSPQALEVYAGTESDTAVLCKNLIFRDLQITNEDFSTVEVDLGEYAGKTVYLGFKACYPKSTYDIHLDDISVLSCKSPSAPSIWSGTESALVRLQEEDASGILAEYGPETSEEWIGLDVAGTEIPIGNLLPSTTYRLRLRRVCGQEDSSNWTVLTFRTLDPAVEPPLDENFDNTPLQSLPEGWLCREGNAAAEQQWSVGENDLAAELKHFAYFNSSTTEAGIGSVLETPLLDVSRFKDLNLAFMYLNSGSEMGSSSNRLCVYISTDQGLTFDTLFQNLTTSGLAIGSESIDLSPYLEKATDLKVYFSAVSNQNSTFDIFLDNVYIGRNASCSRPESVSVTQYSSHEAVVSWDEIPDASYQIVYYKQDGEEAFSVKGPAHSPDTLSGLETVPYKVGVRRICAESDTGDLRLCLYLPVPCLPVTDLEIGPITDTSALLSWKHSEASSFLIALKAETETEFRFIATGADSLLLGGLLPGTRYEIGVQAILKNDSSQWNESEFLTECSDFLLLPFYEGAEKQGLSFDNFNYVPPCWESEEIGEALSGQSYWQRSQSPVFEGSYSLSFAANRIQKGGIGRLYSQEFKSTKALRLSLMFYHNQGKTNDELRVGIVHGNDTAILDSIRLNTGVQEWKEYAYVIKDIPQGRIFLEGYAEWGTYNIFIDALKLEEIDPVNLEAVSIEPIQAQADMPAQEIRFQIRNAGLEDFAGKALLCFSVEGQDTVREEADFSQTPLAIGETFTYRFDKKAEFDGFGIHRIEAFVRAEGDTKTDDDRTYTEAESYRAYPVPVLWNLSQAELPLNRFAIYDLDKDGKGWQWESGFETFYCEGNGENRGNDLLYLPAIALKEGKQRVNIVLGNNGQEEKVDLFLARSNHPDSLESAYVLGTGFPVTRTVDTLRFEMQTSVEGNYYLGIRTDAKIGLYFYGISVDPSQIIEHLQAESCQNEGYVFGNDTLYESGLYADTIALGPAKDSIAVLDLTIHPSYVFTLDTSICQGRSIVFGGNTYSESGEYEEHFLSVYGCDSTYVLTLEVKPLPVRPDIRLEQQQGEQALLVSDQEQLPHRWYLNEEEIADSTGSSLLTSEYGIYFAKTYNECGLSEASNRIEIKEEADNLSDRNAEEIRLYPNPAEDKVAVEAPGRNILSVEILKSTGERILEIRPEAQKCVMETGSLRSGLYLLRIRTEKGFAWKKLIVR